MKNIIVINQKGGVGKTILTDEIAFSLDRTKTPYSIYDLDGQGGLNHQTKEDPAAVVSLADTPGALQGSMMKDLIEGADVIVIPTRPAMTDMPPLTRTENLVGQLNPSAHVIYVVNGWNRFKLAASFMETFSSSHPGAEVYIIPQCEAVPTASLMKRSVQDIAKWKTPGQAMLGFTNAVRRAAGLAEEFI